MLLHTMYSGGACETCRKPPALAAVLVGTLLLAAPPVGALVHASASAAAQRASAVAPAEDHRAAAGGAQPGHAPDTPGAPAEADPSHGADRAAHAETQAHDQSPWGLIGKVVNFTLLAATLVYFLRAPVAAYLRDRGEQIRTDLVTAERMKREAGEQIAAIEARLKDLPAELDALKARGRAEIEAEEERIRTTAEIERDRLLDQARRAIDLQVRTAKRDLVAHAADLAVGVARERIGRQITDDDQRRLLERYLSQVRPNA